LQGELGAIMLRNGFVEQGMHWLHRALKRDSHCTQAHQALAEYYQQLGDAEKAEIHRRHAGVPPLGGGAKSGPTR
jgi:Tfp pilus assembly protein PilF